MALEYWPLKINSSKNKKIELNSSKSYTILITDLLIDEISGIALGIVLKKKRPAFIFGINNGSEACKIVAIENGFNMVYDVTNVLGIILQCFPIGNQLNNNYMELMPYSNVS